MQIDFIKETDHKGSIAYYTRIDGIYVTDSLALDEAKAKSFFELIKENGPNALKTKVEILETVHH
jgi:hypothetical protein